MVRTVISWQEVPVGQVQTCFFPCPDGPRNLDHAEERPGLQCPCPDWAGQWADHHVARVRSLKRTECGTSATICALVLVREHTHSTRGLHSSTATLKLQAAPLARFADGSQLVAGVGNRVLIYDAVDGDLLHALKGHKVGGRQCCSAPAACFHA